MKNNLEPWESDLRARVKDHEFPYDPAALASFEKMLAAEPAAPRPVMSSLPKVLLLLLGLLLIAGAWFLTTDAETPPAETPEPATEMTTPAVAPPPAVRDSPAAVPAAPSARPPARRSRPAPATVLTAPAAPPPTRRAAPRPRPIDGRTHAVERKRVLPGITPMRVRRPLEVVPVPPRALPKVTIEPAPVRPLSRREKRRLRNRMND